MSPSGTNYEPTQPIKLCKDCKHRSRWWTTFVITKCNHPSLMEESPLNGRTKRKKDSFTQCSYERGEFGACGPDGKNWEAK